MPVLSENQAKFIGGVGAGVGLGIQAAGADGRLNHACDVLQAQRDTILPQLSQLDPSTALEKLAQVQRAAFACETALPSVKLNQDLVIGSFFGAVVLLDSLTGEGRRQQSSWEAGWAAFRTACVIAAPTMIDIITQTAQYSSRISGQETFTDAMHTLIPLTIATIGVVQSAISTGRVLWRGRNLFTRQYNQREAYSRSNTSGIIRNLSGEVLDKMYTGNPPKSKSMGGKTYTRCALANNFVAPELLSGHLAKGTEIYHLRGELGERELMVDGEKKTLTNHHVGLIVSPDGSAVGYDYTAAQFGSWKNELNTPVVVIEGSDMGEVIERLDKLYETRFEFSAAEY